MVVKGLDEVGLQKLDPVLKFSLFAIKTKKGFCLSFFFFLSSFSHNETDINLDHDPPNTKHTK